MRGLYLAVLLLSLCSAPAGAEQKLNVNIPGGGAQDLLNMTDIPRSISDKGYDPTMTMSCTNAEGRIVHQADPEYKRCIARTEGLKKPPPRKGAVQAPSQPDASHIITIQGPAQGN